MTSMDDFGPVSVDYYHGRRVEEVIDGDGAKDAPVWSIRLEGDAYIHNFDPSIPKPTTIIGAALTRTLLEARKTRLQFGLEQVTLNPMEYAISDPSYTGGQRVYAQRSRYNMPPVAKLDSPDEPQGRDADAPEVHPDDA